MAERALGNTEAADAALKRAGDLSGAESMAHPAPDREDDAAPEQGGGGSGGSS